MCFSPEHYNSEYRGFLEVEEVLSGGQIFYRVFKQKLIGKIGEPYPTKTIKFCRSESEAIKFINQYYEVYDEKRR